MHLAGPSELIAARVLPAPAPLTSRGLRLRITLGPAQDLLSALANARADLVVSAVRPTGWGITATPLTDEEFVLVGSPALARTIDPGRLGEDPVGAARASAAGRLRGGSADHPALLAQ
ncbi:LysR substrate-binding domain-containing protein [Streptomyces sp. NA02950]|uniref:LysR substrate-binding domain-containing protein n=1 Tax=Streptomyces sp. NA02950 TaxID=2742137 RepID=UPI0020CADF9A|nr:LysR substrate-binding domain-containing protein [Streptomyces sp. NA02950]